LRRHRWPAVLDLTVANMKWSGGLTPTRVERLVQSGWELASHTIGHPDLTVIDPHRMRHEVADSRRILRAVFRVPVNHFCYPAGKYDAGVVAAVRRAGYRGATTVASGLAVRGSRFELRRIRVNRSDGVSGLRSKLRNARG
jgi:peptidoglycan/xylan/chitin deacetylase (PgdA/CDA1 family)